MSECFRLTSSGLSTRAALRLTLLRLTNDRMLLNPTHLQRDIDPASLSRHDGLLPQEKEDKTWVGKKTGLRHPQMESAIELNGNAKEAANGFAPKQKYNDVTEYLMSKVLTPEKLRKPEDTVSILTRIGKLGEILYILRPLIYGKSPVAHIFVHLTILICPLHYSTCHFQVWTPLMATMADLSRS